ncbi:MAG: ABC transporter substrate-binding protein [SAR324 cluster bacterium]|nr:ABC transporter substrate-binding protein [SAR324 cluster bacterium]
MCSRIDVLKICRCLLGVFIISGSWSLQKLHAEDLHIAIGRSLPPYVIQKSNSGMELDIVRESLKHKGYSLKPRYVALKQVPIVYNKKWVDGAMTITEDFGINAYFSDVVMTYQNFAITLAKNNLQINLIEDLQGKSIVAFQNAKIYLGEAFSKAVQSNPSYSEVANQLYQVNRLYSGRADVVISDKNIFLYYKIQAQVPDTKQKIVFHSVFPPNPYKVAFREQKIRNDFNVGLKQLRESGRYQKIIQHYIQDQ